FRLSISINTLAICKDSGYSFSLEAVKTLKKLMETDTSTNPVLCGKDDADEVFQRLGWLMFFDYVNVLCSFCTMNML
uniref:Uncharacterized protein n=1 Tax=Cyprinus carpio TaxID=7962 RepID=A0A8C1LLJ7_CYPCA